MLFRYSHKERGSDTVSGPLLKKIKVLEMAHVISGPYAGMLLADLGADVIKAEMPGTGDYFRLWDGKDEAIRPSFATYNRGKRSVTINVQTQSHQWEYLCVAMEWQAGFETPSVDYRFLKNRSQPLGSHVCELFCDLPRLGPSLSGG